MTGTSFHDDQPEQGGCANGCNAPFGIRCSVCNTTNRAGEETPWRSMTTALVAELNESATYVASGRPIRQSQRFILERQLQEAAAQLIAYETFVRSANVQHLVACTEGRGCQCPLGDLPAWGC